MGQHRRLPHDADGGSDGFAATLEELAILGAGRQRSVRHDGPCRGREARAVRPQYAGTRYHPERHYMRGPGPKTLSKLGEMYREETKDLLRERLPDEWVALIRAIEEPDRDR